MGLSELSSFLALAFLFSSDRKNIRWKYVGILLAIQLSLHLSCLKLQWESRLLVVFQTVLTTYY
ncbi:Na+ dependent nucleoside transporter N-terminal domain-containing protein [Staphylococcus aureus]